jgi:hypothetical protein
MVAAAAMTIVPAISVVRTLGRFMVRNCIV